MYVFPPVEYYSLNLPPLLGGTKSAQEREIEIKTKRRAKKRKWREKKRGTRREEIINN